MRTSLQTADLAQQMRAPRERSGEQSVQRRAPLDETLAREQKRMLRAALCHKADAVAPEIGISPQVLRAAAQEDTEQQLPFRRVPQLLQSVPDPMPLLAWWASLVGCVVYRVPVALEGTPLCDAVQQFADVMSAEAEAQRDGRYSAEEAARIEREGTEAIAAIRAYIEFVQRQAGRAA